MEYEQDFEVLSDREFIQFIAGNQEVFRKIFDSYHRRLYSFVFSFTKSHHDTEEIIQDTFVTLYTNRENLRDATGIYPYLFVVAKRLLISEFRKKVVRSKYQHYIAFHWSESTTNTQDQLAERELSSTLDNLIAKLPKKEQQVYKLNKLEGMSYQEIAEKCGQSKNTVKNQIIAASKKLRWKLDKIYFLNLLMALTIL
ncbi:RNA polymerase sigma factor [Sphingobacterium wenxiniae]|uniref:RNA polymerase sigma-70 factor, ECF subfamily n=1 Tax=Sphingobacterium wenxiniae TaxID=683125 RepID=A0A1I6U9B5_9SPHI|nr:RNA polymerase sigma-70 factor [Sphingobacterium wenxiniae]SFS97968.1 RNA polymerase sigma-70 factor, ECF subfamily [Sphingobacterium wenxiniae]